jgi:outer membrane protein assembly factor BamB
MLVMIMSTNPLVKPLKMFDPKTDLVVNESFAELVKDSVTDTLSEMELDPDRPYEGEVKEREFASLNTGGAIRAGCILLENDLNRTIIAAANIKGEVFLLEPDAQGLTILSKISVQGEINTSPAYTNGIIYIVTKDGSVYAYDTGLKKSGDHPPSIKTELLWQKKMKKGIYTEPLATKNVLIVTPLNGLYAFEAFKDRNESAGEPLWGMSINGTVSTPRIEAGMLVIGTEDKKLMAFDYGGNRLQQLWEYELSDACRTRPCSALKTEQVVAGTIDGFIYSVERRTGKYKWNFVAGAPVLSSVIPGEIDEKDHFFVGSDSGLFFCLDQFGKKIWDFKTNGRIRTEAVIHNGRIYFGSEDSCFYCLELNSGREVFRFQIDGNIYGRPLVAGDRVYFGSTDSFVHALNL